MTRGLFPGFSVGGAVTQVFGVSSLSGLWLHSRQRFHPNIPARRFPLPVCVSLGSWVPAVTGVAAEGHWDGGRPHPHGGVCRGQVTVP